MTAALVALDDLKSAVLDLLPGNADGFIRAQLLQGISDVEKHLGKAVI